MAKPYKTESGKWRIQVKHDGVRRSAVFNTRQEALQWQGQVLQEPMLEKSHVRFGELIHRYIDEVLIKTPSYRSDRLRLLRFIRDFPHLANKTIDNIKGKDVTQWRNKRLSEVSNASIIREWAILSSVYRVAIEEWYLTNHNPFKDARRPPRNPPRTTILSDSDIKRMLEVLGYVIGTPPVLLVQQVGAAMLLSIETGLRCQEITGLKRSDIVGQVASVRKSKTHAGIRQVPLSKTALAIIEDLKAVHAQDEEDLFDIDNGSLSTLFRRYRQKAGLEGFTFHDCRATACTRLAKKVQITDLARILGHSDLSKLMIYYRESADNIAKLLD